MDLFKGSVDLFRVTRETSLMGRRFFPGDRVFISNNVLFHCYINEDKDIEILQVPNVNISIENRGKLFSNCRKVNV